MRKDAKDSAEGRDSKDAPNYAPEALLSSLLICDVKVEGVADKSSSASKLIDIEQTFDDSDLTKSTSVPLYD